MMIPINLSSLPPSPPSSPTSSSPDLSPLTSESDLSCSFCSASSSFSEGTECSGSSWSSASSFIVPDYDKSTLTVPKVPSKSLGPRLFTAAATPTTNSSNPWNTPLYPFPVPDKADINVSIYGSSYCIPLFHQPDDLTIDAIVAAMGGWSWREARELEGFGELGELGGHREHGSEPGELVGSLERQVSGETSTASVISNSTFSSRYRIRSGGISVLIPSLISEYLDDHICPSTSNSEDSEDQERSPKRQKLMPKEPKEPETEEKVKRDDISESSDSDSDSDYGYGYDSNDNAWPSSKLLEREWEPKFNIHKAKIYATRYLQFYDEDGLRDCLDWVLGRVLEIGKVVVCFEGVGDIEGVKGIKEIKGDEQEDGDQVL